MPNDDWMLPTTKPSKASQEDLDEIERLEQDERDRQLAYELATEDNALEKKIQPVGFSPSTKIEQLVAMGVQNGTITGSLFGLEEIQKDQAALNLVHEWLRDNRPCRYALPNVGQEKALLPLKTIDPSEPEVHRGVFCGANMVGKTADLAFLSVGIIWGRNELHEFWGDWKIFEKFENIRKNERRALRIRIICHAGGMEDGGQVMEELTKWWPKGLYKWEKNHKAYYSVCKCWDMDGKLLAVVNVRTHDQPRHAHAGHTLDAILNDEPLPEHLWAENVARLRQPLGGLLWMFLSPLDEAGWIQDRLASNPEIHFTNACIWDNCNDFHPDPMMWSGKKIGVGKVLTRGTRARKIIQALINEWENEGPEIADARMNGNFTHLSGSVLKSFSKSTHMIAPFPIPPHWPIFQGVDPHDARPHLSGWFTQDEQGNIYHFAEYPNIRWDNCRGSISVADACAAWRQIEEPFRLQLTTRVADPMRMKATKSVVKSVTNFHTEFAGEGFSFEMGNNSIAIGLSRIREALAFDPKNAASRPHLFFMSHNPYTGERNQNFIEACMQFSYKKGMEASSNSREIDSIFEEKWKDPIDVLRYIILRIGTFSPVSRLARLMKKARPKVTRSARPWMRG